MDSVIFSPPKHKHTLQHKANKSPDSGSGRVRSLTVSGQVVDERGQEGDEDTGDDDVDDVEERFAFDDQVEGDVLVLVALHGDVFVGVPLGWTVDDLPLAIL